LDVFIFVSGAFAAMYLADAVTMAGLIEIDPREWHTEAGYPAFCFNPERVEAYADKLTAAGYAVHLLEPAEQIREQFAGSTQRAEVVNIADARCRRRNL
jgi:DNA mismatch repair ATPase MutS